MREVRKLRKDRQDRQETPQGTQNERLKIAITIFQPARGVSL